MNFFITNREILGDYPYEIIRPDGCEHASDNMRFGEYDIASQQFKLYEEIGNPADALYSNFSGLDPKTLKGSARFFCTLYNALVQEETNITSYGIEKGDVLFFIHGFNTNLKGVQEAFHNLHQCYVENVQSPIKHIVIFTWPGMSPKLPLNYLDDKKDAIRSGEAFARGFDKMIQFIIQFVKQAKNKECNHKMHLMVHSMGNRVLKHLMLNVQNRLQFFEEIILMASDIEYDIFEPTEAFVNLIDMGRRIHIYYHLNDRVLDISKFTKNFSNRLGRYGRKQVRDYLHDVHDINITQTSVDNNFGFEERALNHWYYYTSSEVVNDVIHVLNGNESYYIAKKQ